MQDEQLYNNVVLSLIKFIQDWRAENAPDAEYVDWDAHAQISELPTEKVLVGPAGCGLTEESTGMFEVVFSFGISTYQDTNLFRLRSLISNLFGKLKLETRIPIYDAETTAAVSWMVIKAPRALTPVTKAEIRSLQFVELTAAIDPGVTSSLR